jgi:hypothetical protein
MFLIQSFYIHTNLPAACFFLASVACCWFAINNAKNSWLVLMILALFGLSLSRTETFIYSLPILFLLLSNKQKNFKFLNYGFVIYLVSIIAWFVYLSLNLQGGTDILDKSRINVLVFALILLGVSFLFIQIEKFAGFSLPFINKFFLLPFFGINLIMLFLKPTDMMISNKTMIENMFFTGQWGVIFWIWIVTLLSFLKYPQSSLDKYLNKIIISTILIISGLGFFRVPYRLSWNDSANRLITLVFPVILLLAAEVLSTYINSRKLEGEITDISS